MSTTISLSKHNLFGQLISRLETLCKMSKISRTKKAFEVSLIQNKKTVLNIKINRSYFQNSGLGQTFRNINSIPCMNMFDTKSSSMLVVDMKSKLTLCIAVAAVMILSISVNSTIATGAESDSDDHFNNIPGAGDCWQDGYNDGQNGPFSQSRNDGCTDKGNQYYEGFMHGCKDAGNTEDVCVSSTD